MSEDRGNGCIDSGRCGTPRSALVTRSPTFELTTGMVVAALPLMVWFVLRHPRRAASVILRVHDVSYMGGSVPNIDVPQTVKQVIDAVQESRNQPTGKTPSVQGAGEMSETLRASPANTLGPGKTEVFPGASAWLGSALAPRQITKVQGEDVQTAAAGNPVPKAPAVKVVNAGGGPCKGVSVAFYVTEGGGAVTGSPATTNEKGIATLGGWTLGPEKGRNRLVATIGSVSAEFVANAT